MSLLHASNLDFRHPSQPEWLLREATFTVNPGDQIGLIGPNGCGKTTLLRLLTGELDDSQQDLVRRRNLKVAYARQVSGDLSQSLYDYALASHAVLGDLRNEMLSLEKCLDDAACGLRYCVLVTEYAEHGGYEFEAKVSQVLSGLGYSEDEKALPVGMLSGGQRTRAELARVLLTPADLVLLDEPTNHLDLASRTWLEGYLNSLDAASLVVSHDRRFLEVAVSRIFAIRRTRLTVYSGNYQWYRNQRAMEEQQEWDRFHAQERRTKAAEQAAEARMRLARATTATPRGQRERYGKDHFAGKAAKVQKTAKVILARSAKQPRARKPITEAAIPTLSFPAFQRPAETVLRAQSLTKSYGEKHLFDDMSLSISKDDRVAISGPNGCGKSTLLKVLIGVIAPDQGSATLGAGVRIGYFAQDAENLDRTKSAAELCLPLNSDRSWVYTLLASLKLPMDRLHLPIAQMSAGERSKTGIARLLLLSPNMLVLDEPTNHLDIDSQEAIEEALAQFPGPMLFVSHDRRFVDRLATTVIDLAPAHVFAHTGR